MLSTEEKEVWIRVYCAFMMRYPSSINIERASKRAEEGLAAFNKRFGEKNAGYRDNALPSDITGDPNHFNGQFVVCSYEPISLQGYYMTCSDGTIKCSVK